MTQTVSAAMDTAYAQETLSMCKIYKATRKDGIVFGATDHDRDLTVSGVTYKALSALDTSAVLHTLGLAVDNSAVAGAFSSDFVTDEDLKAGLWDHCLVQSWEVNWKDVAQTRWLMSGRLGRVSSGRHMFEAELLSKMQFLQQEIGRTVGVLCDAELGDTRCTVRLDPPTWTASTTYAVRPASDAGSGSVVKPTAFNTRHFYCTTSGVSGGSEPTWNTGVGSTTADNGAVWTAMRALTFTGTLTGVTSGNRIFANSASTDPPSGFFSEGKFTFASGANSGLAREVKTYANSTGTFTTHRAFPFTVTVGDAYNVSAGCRKQRIADCVSLYNNVYNHKGFDLLPGMDKLIAGGLPIV